MELNKGGLPKRNTETLLFIKNVVYTIPKVKLVYALKMSDRTANPARANIDFSNMWFIFKVEFIYSERKKTILTTKEGKQSTYEKKENCINIYKNKQRNQQKRTRKKKRKLELIYKNKTKQNKTK